MPNSENIIEHELLPLSTSEAELLHLIRTKYRFGEVTIETRDGQPTFIVQTTIREKLG